MATFFLIIIYLAFISLGLPDSLLGVAWPVMQTEFDAPLETAGLLFMIIAGGTIVSSLASGTVIHKLGTGKVTFISCVMTAGALFGYSIAPSLFWLAIFAIPLGLGAGSVDAALNNYVATHYKAHHMSWLHCFWGVGATLGPIIMAQFMKDDLAWRSGYLTVAWIQFGLVVLLFFTLPLWKRVPSAVGGEFAGDSGSADLGPEQETAQPASTRKLLGMKGATPALLSCLFYCGAEATMGLWGSSFLVGERGISTAVAASWVSLYYGGITVGRFIAGFITFKVSNKGLIRMGQIISLVGAALLLLPLPDVFSLIGFILVGLGFAPVYPCMLHETPVRFGKANSQKMMGFQMAVAYTGSTFLPPLLGGIASVTAIGIFPFFIAVYIVAMLIGSERINLIMKARGAA